MRSVDHTLKAFAISCAALALLAAGGVGASVEKQPLQGQGMPAPEDKPIYVSSMLERLLDVNGKNYRFETLQWVYLSWTDDRARQSVIDSTDAYRNGTNEVCVRPCSSTPAINREQTGYTSSYSCCDDVWLPTIQIMNYYEMPSTDRYGINVNMNATSGGGAGEVVWFTLLRGEYFYPMNFEDYPFDDQNLVIEFGSPGEGVSSFVPSMTCTQMFLSEDDAGRADRKEGEGYGWHEGRTNGWKTKGMTITAADVSIKDFTENIFAKFADQPSAESDPVPLAELKWNPILSVDGIINKFAIVLVVSRINRVYFYSQFSFMAIVMILSFITYLIPAAYLGFRLSMNLTLFLALTNLNIAISDLLPVSSRATIAEKLVVLYFVCVAFAIPQCLISHLIGKRGEKSEDPRAADPLFSGSFKDLFRRFRTYTKKEVWSIIKKREHSIRVAFIIDMVTLTLMITTVTVLTLVIMNPIFHD
jgi:hypothetical protein